MPSSPIITAIKRAPFKKYNCRCRTPLFWSEAEERKVFEPDILKKKPRSKFVWLGRTCELRNQGRRGTSIIGEET
jgi:hypothetical protein